MDLQTLLHRKAELEQARTNTANSWQILTGHIQECDYMINLLGNEPEEQPEEQVALADELPVE